MLNKSALLLGGMVMVLSMVSTGCAPKTRQALKAAQQAMSAAEAQNAPVKSPEIYEQARQHLDRGRRYELDFRFGLARVEYEAAAGDARLALALAGEQEPRPVPSRPRAQPAAEESKPCCLELNLCSQEQQELKDRLAAQRNRPAAGRAPAPLRTRVIHEPCEQPAPPPARAELLMGTLLVEPPEGIVKDKTDYAVKVRYLKTPLEGRSPSSNEDNYRILLDVAEVEPPEVEVFSPTADFEPLSAHGGEWDLAVNVPQGFTKPVKLKILATLRNNATGAERKLPGYEVTIPNTAAGPRCPEVRVEKPRAAAQASSDWLVRMIMVLLGLGSGLAAGFFIFARAGKKGPSIKIGE